MRTTIFGIVGRRRWLVGLAATALGLWTPGEATAESVVIVQGFQAQADKYAANTTDALITAFQGTAESVTALRPKLQPGWEGGESYATKAELLSRVGALLAGNTVILVIVGDADDSGGLLTGDGTSATATELADAVAGASQVSLVSAGCNDLSTAVGSHLQNTGTVISGVTSGQTAHTWPSGNQGQYDLYSRYLVEAFYLLAPSDPNASMVLGKAHTLASAQTVSMSGGAQTPTQVGPSGTLGAQTAGPVAVLSNREYLFAFQSGGGQLTGYVANALSLPIAPVTSASVQDGVTSFSFVERGRTRTVKVSDVSGVPAVTIDGRPESFSYRPARVDLLSDSKPIGVAYVTAPVGANPWAVVIAADGSESRSQSYDVSRRALAMSLPTDGGSMSVQVRFGVAGTLLAQVGSAAEYRATDVLSYSFYGEDGRRIATAVALRTGDVLNGEVRPEAGAMRLPLEAKLDGGAISGAASLVGNRYTLGTDWSFSTNRPPTQGKVQSDYLDLPQVHEVYANDAAGGGRVTVSWQVDSSNLSDAILGGDLRFQVIRTERFSGKATAFDVAPGRRQYTDRPDDTAAEFDYAVRPILDHRVTRCDAVGGYPLLGEAVAAKAGAPAPKSAVAPPVVVHEPSAPIEEHDSDLAQATEGEMTKKSERAKEVERAEEVEAAEKEKEREDDDRKPWKKKEESEGLAGKIIYGLLGVLIVLGITIAGGGGGPSDIEPN